MGEELGSRAVPCEHSAADMACLVAAKAYGLRRHRSSSLLCPGSEAPDVGWWARATWSGYHVDPSKGGPWSVEHVHRLCTLGLLGVAPHNEAVAELTAAGKKLVRPVKNAATKGKSEDGSTPQIPSQPEGEADV